MSNAQGINTIVLLLAGAHSLLWITVAGFESPTTFRKRHRLKPVQTIQSGLFSSASDQDDSIRRMLESSWNTSKMGRVPADPEAAAEEAYSSILQAAGGTKTADDDSIEEEDDMVGIFFVDLLLPAYDISQVVEGIKLYDEVLAVEYCIALADCFKGKTEILVRNDNIVQTVTKVLNARENPGQEQTPMNDADVVFGDGDFVDNRSDSDGDVVFGDGNFVDNRPDDVDDVSGDDQNSNGFRQQLLASWKNDDSDAPSDYGIDVPPSQPSEPAQNPDSIIPKTYRLASLFGDREIKQGPDMTSVVIQAVRENALAADDEENIIILSARDKDEMIAVRGLVGKYASEKKIILVNCQFQRVPIELLGAQTVYSVLPLAGKKMGDSNDDNETPPPRIVVLRRYPKDWEIFVDVGIGYELAETVKANTSNRRGLGMEFIARAVERHLDFVSRR